MIKLARVFSDNMVLQCGQEIAVWGTSDAEGEISVLLNGDEICRAKVLNFAALRGTHCNCMLSSAAAYD